MSSVPKKCCRSSSRARACQERHSDRKRCPRVGQHPDSNLEPTDCPTRGFLWEDNRGLVGSGLRGCSDAQRTFRDAGIEQDPLGLLHELRVVRVGLPDFAAVLLWQPGSLSKDQLRSLSVVTWALA